MCGSDNEKAGFLKLVGRYIGLVMFGHISAIFFLCCILHISFFFKDFHQQQTVCFVHQLQTVWLGLSGMCFGIFGGFVIAELM
jgi:hypothetical protein